MVAFACPRCGVRLTVKPEFAGRATRCPACQQPLRIPGLEATQAFVAPGEVAGHPSSAARAGIDGGPTLGPPEGAPSGRKSVREMLAGGPNAAERYVIEGEIARGGMGAVLRAVDRDLRREVAVKFMLDPADAEKKLRFVEEAQITGQLEHPNIVPIHELGLDAHKRLFFSMKMVQGRSLAQVLDGLRKEPRTTEKEWPLSRLLTIFVNVCHALAYAHSRGVVHRDLKPANVMVGDFGEVYVMDWGLAKVLHGPQEQPAAPEGEAPARRPSKVETSRGDEADLTQDGAVLGTPAYMPPEQACGRVADVGPRSDVYSLGAILYELLTLKAPVAKDGGYLAVLMRVAEGEIVPPEQRAPERARAGRVPRELSAVAMKALAKDPADRYPSAEALRRDVERFQEGRSVSAKPDSVRELAWKLVKRNKAASLTAAAALLVLAGVVAISFRAILHARDRAESALAAREEEERAKRERGSKSAPLFVEDARRSAQQGKTDYARAQVDVALEYDPDNVEARLMKGQLLVAQKDLAAAARELEQYVARRPQDHDAAELLRLCRGSPADDPRTLHALALVLFRQGAGALAVQVEQDRDTFLRASRQKIDIAWPGLGAGLQFNEGGLEVIVPAKAQEARDLITDLKPLEGLPLTRVWVRGCRNLQKLDALQGMKLTELDLQGCPEVHDLTPLRDMPLTYLNLGGCRRVSNLEPIKGKHLTFLDLGHCTEVRDPSPLKGMPLTFLSLHGCKQFKDFSFVREFSGLEELHVGHCEIKDLDFLKGMNLKSLSAGRNPAIRKLKPLEGMPIRVLGIEGCKLVTDLELLKGMRLTRLNVVDCPQFNNLALLKGKSLTKLDIFGTGVTDLRPLEGMEVEFLNFDPRKITQGMDVLMPGKVKGLQTITTDVPGRAGPRLSPAKFWQMYEAGEFPAAP